MLSSLKDNRERFSRGRRILPYGAAALLGVLGLVAGSGSAIAQPIGAAVTPAGPPLSYSYWTLPPSAVSGYDRLYQSVTPNNMPVAAPGQPTPVYFYAMQWYNAANLSQGGYVGLQTDSQGKKAIFSWWGGINGHGPGISRPFTAEGVGWQNIITYDWQPGRSYKLTVNHTSTTSSGSWFTATILDGQTNRSSTIGSIEIPTAFGGIYESINNFVEWYGASQVSCANYPRSDVTFSAPQGRARAGNPTVSSAASNPPSGTPNGPDCSTVSDSLRSMEHVNGTP